MLLSLPTPEEPCLANLEQQGAISTPWLLLQLRLSQASRKSKEMSRDGGDEYLRRIQRRPSKTLNLRIGTILGRP